MLTFWIALVLAGAAALLIVIYPRYKPVQIAVDVLAIVSFYVFFLLSASAVLRTIRDDTVFMTEVHGVFLHPLFLLSGAWIGPYILMQLWLLLVRPDNP